MSGANTGLLTARCDPYGIESTVKLMGGVYPEKYMGKHIWYCEARAEARYRLVCTGGRYGVRLTPGAGLDTRHTCDGGHRGVEMPLCNGHAAQLRDGPPPGQVGGPGNASVCPACMMPPAARVLSEQIEAMNPDIYFAPTLLHRTRLTARQDGLRAQIDELRIRGLVHKCPLRLTEVS